MDKYIVCYDKETASLLDMHLDLIVKNNDTYIYKFDEEKLARYSSEFSSLDYQIVDKLILEF